MSGSSPDDVSVAAPPTLSDDLSYVSLSPREEAASTVSSATEADEASDQPDVGAGLSAEERQVAALKAKEEGNKEFLASRYEQAKEQYSRAIHFDSSVAVYFSNRAACELKLEQFGLAIEDAGTSRRREEGGGGGVCLVCAS